MQLPVLKPTETDIALQQLKSRLRGQVRVGLQDRLVYATDASVYQVEPLAVVIPADRADAATAVTVCAELGLPMLPRGGGTSLAGQCTNRAVVIDTSMNLRKIQPVDVNRRTVWAEAGATLDEVNRNLTAAGCGLFYAPDPATVAQASVGGCIGNNAAGARSIKYGRTSENISAMDVILATGQTVRFCANSTDAPARELARQVAGIVRKNAGQIRQRFPKTIRRNAGYGLDLILQQIDAGIADEDLDLCGLICGSEGTLAVVLAAELKLHPIPKARGLAVVPFDSLTTAIAAVPAINATGATAVELLDDVVLTAAAGNRECLRYLDRLPHINGILPNAVLYVEYCSFDESDSLASQFEKLQAVVPHAKRITDPAALADLWALRKAGEPLLHSVGGGVNGKKKPQTFVEDNAVPAERLGEFVAGFRKILDRHHTKAAYWAHASVGVLHVRPLVDLHVPEDRQKMVEIAIEVADLARSCGGVMSGEHGDGKARGPLLERFYGPELMDAFLEIKRLFDPKNLLNPGNMLERAEVKTIAENLRMDRQRLSGDLESIDTFYDYSDQHGFASAVEMCNGAGVCRKTAGGTMCPSYRGLLDERHSTRGRGNALRLAITGQMKNGDQPAWDDPATIQTLDLCLSCKACKSECPSNVDIARLKSEFTAQRYRRTGTPWTVKLLGHVRWLNELGGLIPKISNWMQRQKPMRAILNHLLDMAPQRSLPPFGTPLRKWFGKNQSRTAGQKVMLYEDCFCSFGESHIGQAAVKLLERLGYEVVMPAVGCCGRPMVSQGMLPEGMAAAEKALAIIASALSQGCQAVLFLEPSCLSMVKDDWLQLKLPTAIEARKAIAEKSMLVEEFIERFWNSHPIPPAISEKMPEVLMHGHCHQKAVWGQTETAAALGRVSEKVKVLDGGCCGMAGAFGFGKNRYELSMKIGEMVLLPAVRAANNQTTVAAGGTSCRHQILDGAQKHVLHPVEILEKATR